MIYLLFIMLTSGALNEIYGPIYISLALLILFPYIKKKRVYINALRSASIWFLALFGITYAIIGEYSYKGLIYYFFAPSLAYAAGWTTIEQRRNNVDQYIVNIIYCMLIGYAIHALLNYCINIGNERWNLIDYYTGNIRAATGSGFINTMTMSLFSFFIFIEKRKKYRALCLLIMCITLFYAMLLGTRAQFIIMIVIFGLVTAFIMNERYGAVGTVFYFVILILIISAIYAISVYDIFGINTYISKTNIALRFSDNTKEAQQDSDVGRIYIFYEGIKQLIEEPFGTETENLYYHNMWLDVGRNAGILPFIAMFTFTTISLVKMWRNFKNKAISINVRYMWLSLCVGLHINFFVEPVIEGTLHTFIVYCCLDGMMNKLYEMRKI